MSAGHHTNRNVYVVADNILSPLGNTTVANFSALQAGQSGIKRHLNAAISPEPFMASLFDNDEAFYNNNSNKEKEYIRFERLVIASVSDALDKAGKDFVTDKTVFILSTTKGNISLLETTKPSEKLYDRVALSTSANLIASHFGFNTKPVVISNACISGVLAMITAMRLIRSGEFDSAVVVGADVISKFVVSGFQSFQALSNEICKPFDKNRDGLNLGEGAGTIILSSDAKYAGNTRILGGSVSNDANHISGPSRTGEELKGAINHALKDADKTAAGIDFISAHGTATVYNDEMEAAAITLAGLQEKPLNSLKANYGHTLGAAGIMETLISIQSLKNNILMPTVGYHENGVSNPINVCEKVSDINAQTFLKTASGFGGCNGAIVLGH